MKFFILLIFVSLNVSAADLKIEEHEVFQTLMQEFKSHGSSPEVYPLSEKYRLDLTLIDLIDQATLLAKKYPGFNKRLKASLKINNDLL